MTQGRSIQTLGLFQSLYALYGHISERRRRQLASLLVLQIVGAAAEVVSLGAVLPFLGALANAEDLLARPELQPWLERVDVTTSSGLIALMAAVFGATVVLVNGLRLLTLWVQTRLSAAIGSDLSIEVYRRTLHQPYEFHVNLNSGMVISTITNDLNATLRVLYNLMTLVTQSLVIVCIVAALLSYNAPVALVMAMLIAAAYALITKVSRRRLMQNSQLSSDNYILLMKALQEGLGGIRDILLDNSQANFLDVYAKADRPMRRAVANIQFIRTVPRYVLEAIGILLLCAAATALAWNVEKDFQDILPLLGAMALAANRLLPAVQQSYASIAGIQGSQVSLRRTLAALARSIDPISLARPTMPLPFDEAFSFDGVWFHYGPPPMDGSEPAWVLKDIHMEVAANTTIALVGVTGGGKSTIADIALGLLHPQRGRLLVDGQVVEGERLVAWRTKVAHVPQSIYLSDASIAENIAFGVPAERIDMGRIKEAAHLARIAGFVETRPDGYDEIVGERGIRLSGGQRQRIGIARALYKRASVIIFDEATSALDTTTEEEVMEAIANLSGRRTLVLIAHRLSTVRNADTIFEIQQGRVVASGGYEELISNSETFRAMAHGMQSRVDYADK